MLNAQSATYAGSAFACDGTSLTLAKMKDPLKIVWSCPLPEGCKPSTVTVSKDGAGRYFVSLLLEEEIQPLRCFDCGHVLETLDLDEREWTCPKCHVLHDRDINAARNILAEGLSVNACGERVRPARAKAQTGNPR